MLLNPFADNTHTKGFSGRSESTGAFAILKNKQYKTAYNFQLAILTTNSKEPNYSFICILPLCATEHTFNLLKTNQCPFPSDATYGTHNQNCCTCSSVITIRHANYCALWTLRINCNNWLNLATVTKPKPTPTPAVSPQQLQATRRHYSIHCLRRNSYTFHFHSTKNKFTYHVYAFQSKVLWNAIQIKFQKQRLITIGACNTQPLKHIKNKKKKSRRQALFSNS